MQTQSEQSLEESIAIQGYLAKRAARSGNMKEAIWHEGRVHMARLFQRSIEVNRARESQGRLIRWLKRMLFVK